MEKRIYPVIASAASEQEEEKSNGYSARSKYNELVQIKAYLETKRDKYNTWHQLSYLDQQDFK